MIKLNLTGKDFQYLLDDHPEVEAQILKGGVANITDALSRRLIKEFSGSLEAEMKKSKDLAIEAVKKHAKSVGLTEVKKGSIWSRDEYELDEKTITLLKQEVWQELQRAVREIAKDEMTEAIRDAIKEWTYKDIRGMIREAMKQEASAAVAIAIKEKLGM